MDCYNSVAAARSVAWTSQVEKTSDHATIQACLSLWASLPWQEGWSFSHRTESSFDHGQAELERVVIEGDKRQLTMDVINVQQVYRTWGGIAGGGGEGVLTIRGTKNPSDVNDDYCLQVITLKISQRTNEPRSRVSASF